MNRREAVQHLHDRHPKVIDAPDEEVDLGELHLEMFWFQGHICEIMDAHSDRRARRCFDTVHRLLVEGDSEVRSAIAHHFMLPHVIFHHDLEWARDRMTPLLAEFCDIVRKATTAELKSGGGQTP